MPIISSQKYTSRTHELIQNILVAVTVSFVAVSLGAAFGILSGRGAFSGMFSAGLIALITGLIGGTRVQCSGPTAPMAAIMAALVANTLTSYTDNTQFLFGMTPDHFFNLICLICGIALILFGLLRIGKLIELVPEIIISGFMTGIGLMIWIGQTKALLGYGVQVITGNQFYNIMIALGTLLLTFLTYPILSRISKNLARILPGTLMALLIMTCVSVFLKLPIAHIVVQSKIHSFAELMDFVSSQVPQNISWPAIKKALPTGLELALISYLDTLMVALIIDRLTGETTKKNQELVAQGVANTAIAFIGGVPGTQASIRSVMMIQEGATLRLAGALVGVFVLLQLFLFQNILSFIPTAVFSGILLKVGWNVIDKEPFIAYIKRTAHSPNGFDCMIIIGTALVTLYNLSLAVFIFTLLYYTRYWIHTRRAPLSNVTLPHDQH